MDFTSHILDGFSYLTSPNISVKHAFSTRYGSECNGKFSQESMDALCRTLDISPDRIASLKQVHGSSVQIIDDNFQFSIFNYQLFEADAMITQTPGIALMVFTADCVPILLSDPVKKAIGAVHAGWRGTAMNIAAAAVSKMESEFGCSPQDIRAAIGPCISKCCFETDWDVPDALGETLGDAAESCIIKKGSKYMIDLKNANRLMLEGAGICDISISGDCTVCAENGSKYWSHRRQGRNRGSQVSLIVMEN